MYQLLADRLGGLINTVHRISDDSFIPFSADNTDYRHFKLDLTGGVELLDADGNVMTAEQVQAFLATLPAEEN